MELQQVCFLHFISLISKLALGLTRASLTYMGPNFEGMDPGDAGLGRVVPFGIEQISDFLVVDLHVGHLDSEALLLSLLFLRSFEQSAAQSRNQARLVP